MVNGRKKKKETHPDFTWMYPDNIFTLQKMKSKCYELSRRKTRLLMRGEKKKD